MVKQVLTNLLFLSIGLLIGYIAGCNQKVKIITNDKVTTIVDTIVHTIDVKVPDIKKETVYISTTDTLVNLLTDTLYSNVFLKDSIPINIYTGQVDSSDFRLEYEVKTIGELLSFKPIITTFPRTEVYYYKTKPKWMISGAISNRLNYKLGVGYKGWMLESEFKKGLNQVYIGKQFIF